MPTFADDCSDGYSGPYTLEGTFYYDYIGGHFSCCVNIVYFCIFDCQSTPKKVINEIQETYECTGNYCMIHIPESSRVDFENEIIIARGTRFRLPQKEFEILFYLVKKPNNLIKREKILRDLFGEGYELNFEILREHIKNIRKAIEPDRDKLILIETRQGVGYIYNHFEL